MLKLGPWRPNVYDMRPHATDRAFDVAWNAPFSTKACTMDP